MDKNKLDKLIKKRDLLNKEIVRYLKGKVIKKQDMDKNEVFGHIKKAEHNLRFVKDNLKLNYFDWCITGCYYALYHVSLALALSKGYSSKDHDATLCILIKEFFNKDILESDLLLINSMFINYHDLLFYTKSQNKRKEASYSTKILFDKNNVEKFRIETIEFVDKVKNIIQTK